MNRTTAAAGLALILAASAAPAMAAQPSGGLFEGEGATDVSARDAEYIDAEGLARLRGDVNVIRGDTRLRADAADVYFEQTGEGRQIVRIEAEGDVFYVTPEETVRGDRGVYEVATDTVTMTGDVVLTQGCNVSTGRRLVTNLETGRSQIFGSAEGESGGRVRALFGSGDEAGRDPGDCPRPDVPGDGPIAFDESESADAPADVELGEDPEDGSGRD